MGECKRQRGATSDDLIVTSDRVASSALYIDEYGPSIIELKGNIEQNNFIYSCTICLYLGPSMSFGCLILDESTW